MQQYSTTNKEQTFIMSWDGPQGILSYVKIALKLKN